MKIDILWRLKNSSDVGQFRKETHKLTSLLLQKFLNIINNNFDISIVSILRSGDALLDIFLQQFPRASISKILIQRDPYGLPHFLYKKFAANITSCRIVLILEPMIATGGTLQLVLALLKTNGVQEGGIIVAAIYAAPEGLRLLNSEFPNIKIIVLAIGEGLDEKKYIVPALGDFGDRFFGTS